jgi:hypothetical protein
MMMTAAVAAKRLERSNERTSSHYTTSPRRGCPTLSNRQHPGRRYRRRRERPPPLPPPPPPMPLPLPLASARPPPPPPRRPLRRPAARLTGTTWRAHEGWSCGTTAPVTFWCSPAR